jgi:hypothetical protein
MRTMPTPPQASHLPFPATYLLVCNLPNQHTGGDFPSSRDPNSGLRNSISAIITHSFSLPACLLFRELQPAIGKARRHDDRPAKLRWSQADVNLDKDPLGRQSRQDTWQSWAQHRASSHTKSSSSRALLRLRLGREVCRRQGLFLRKSGLELWDR